MGIIGIYEKVISGHTYNLEGAQKHTGSLFKKRDKIRAKDMPEIEAKFVEENGFGCCLHFAFYLIFLMQKNGIECYLVTTPEEDGSKHASVLYKGEIGRYFVADPVQDVKDETMCNFEIDPYQFMVSAINEDMRVYDLKKTGDLLFFGDFLKYPINI